MRPTTIKRHDRIRGEIDKLRSKYEKRGFAYPLKDALLTMVIRGEYSYSYLRKIYYEP